VAGTVNGIKVSSAIPSDKIRSQKISEQSTGRHSRTSGRTSLAALGSAGPWIHHYQPRITGRLRLSKLYPASLPAVGSHRKLQILRDHIAFTPRSRTRNIGPRSFMQMNRPIQKQVLKEARLVEASSALRGLALRLPQRFIRRIPDTAPECRSLWLICFAKMNFASGSGNLTPRSVRQRNIALGLRSLD
jgi:hypothetical protein